jgi:lipopolysaccharide transport system ATP-binding protein
MLIYLVSYPRSGNTWSRTLIEHCFDVSTYTLYSNRLHNMLVERYGTALPTPPAAEELQMLSRDLRQFLAASQDVFILKTHEMPFSEFFVGERAIHVVRHPGAVFWSYWHFLRDFELKIIDLNSVILGKYFGSWSMHTELWQHAGRTLGEANYLRYSYEQMHQNIGDICERLSVFLDMPIRRSVDTMLSFEEQNRIQPKLVRQGKIDAWQDHYTAAQREFLVMRHGVVMRSLGYSTEMSSAQRTGSERAHGFLMRDTIATLFRAAVVQPHVVWKLLRRGHRRFSRIMRRGHRRFSLIMRRAKLIPVQMRSSPVVLHVTHHKAGSQWVSEVLKYCSAPGRWQHPQLHVEHFTAKNLRPGAILPTLYCTRAQVEEITKDYRGPIRCFVVIRDLRDTLISLYFSLRYSHPEITERIVEDRKLLTTMTLEDGLLYLLTKQVDGVRSSSGGSSRYEIDSVAEMQRSWIHAENRLLVRYEDLIADEQKTFKSIMDYCQIDVSAEHLRSVVADNSFLSTSGRPNGYEDITAHRRMGIAGDWRNYFTQKVELEFKKRYSDHLIETGYEKDHLW